jgi:hypothetical protein
MTPHFRLGVALVMSGASLAVGAEEPAVPAAVITLRRVNSRSSPRARPGLLVLYH